jgi:protocatechuate 3,4-dioxygenase beta subunit
MLNKGIIFLLAWTLLVVAGTAYSYVEYPKTRGDLVFRDSEEKIYGRDGDVCAPPSFGYANAVQHPGHVGIYVGNDMVIHALGWIGAGTEVKKNRLSLLPGIQTFYSDDNGEQVHYPLGAKTHKDLLNNSNAHILRENIIYLAERQTGEEYDANFAQQKGPDSGDWTCCGFVEKVYESCAGQTLIYHEQEEGYNYGDEDLYAGGLNITPDGHEYHIFNSVCYFQTNVEFSQIIPSTIFNLIGREFDLESYIYFPYTQFLQPKLIDSFALPEFYLLSGTLTDASGDPLQGYVYANETTGANLGNHVYSSDGTYEMALFPGTYRVYAYVYNSYSGGYYYLSTPYETLTVNANTTLNIAVPSYELYHLTGKVSDANGVGLPNIRVYSSGGVCQSYTTTSSDGTYNALVIPGTYHLHFVPPDDSGFIQKYLYNIPIYNDYYQEVFLDSQEQYTLSGTITDASGNPLRGWVYANQIGGSYHYNNDYSSDGTYEMSLFLGTYRVYARTYYFGGSTYLNTPYQNITINTDFTFNIVAPSYDFFNLTGKVTDINNVAQANVNIAAYSNSGICQGYIRTDANGDYNLSLIPGTYRLRITAPPATYPPFEIQNLQLSGDSVRNIRLSLEYTILEQAIAQLLANLELSLDVFDIINQEETLNYNIIIQGVKDLLQIILNWQGSEMKITLYDPSGTIYDEYQSANPPINIEIPNPAEGTWTCEVTAVDVPNDNYPFALVVGISPNQAPEADANGPYSGSVDTPITFDASDSYDPDGEIAIYEWDWDGDGVYDQSSNSATITHTWTEPYSGAIYLRVTDGEGTTDTDNTSVEVTATQEIPGDLDGDGDVDYDDYLLFRPCYGSCEGDANYMPEADLDGDNCVTINDYRILRTLM